MSDILVVDNLKVSFRVQEGVIEAVRGVSFRVPKGTTVALVGESGSGKSVVAQTIMGILPKTGHIDSGRILFLDPDASRSGRASNEAVDIARLNPDGKTMRRLRGGRVSIIFQEPMTSLSPLHTIGDQVGEALALHRTCNAAARTELTEEMLRLVGFPDPGKALRTYPFELSGGLRQRVEG